MNTFTDKFKQFVRVFNWKVIYISLQETETTIFYRQFWWLLINLWDYIELMCSSGHRSLRRETEWVRVRERKEANVSLEFDPDITRFYLHIYAGPAYLDRVTFTSPLVWPRQGKYFCLDVNDNCDGCQRNSKLTEKQANVHAEIFQQLSRLLSQSLPVCLSVCLLVPLSVTARLSP